MSHGGTGGARGAHTQGQQQSARGEGVGGPGGRRHGRTRAGGDLMKKRATSGSVLPVSAQKPRATADAHESPDSTCPTHATKRITNG